jgi:carbonic anhydrase/acetyltransferase-like protein (isoleucine patch superfamily)
VYGDALVDRSSMVRGAAHVFGNALVSGSAVVEGNAYIHGDAEVLQNALIYGNAVVCDNAVVAGNSRVYGHAMVCWNARVTGSLHVHREIVVVGILEGGEVFGSPEKKDLNKMREIIFLHSFLENSKVVTLNDVSEESLRHVLEKLGGPTENKSKQDMWEDLVKKRDERLETLRGPSCSDEERREASKEDVFGNTIENPVMGDDGIVYDRTSMEKWFEKKDNGDYRWIPYAYKDGVSVPVYKPVGGEKVLTRYFND